jgi:anti-sigma factor RsiW
MGIPRPGRADCASVRELIAWYPAGDLSESERRRVDDHVKACASCADLLHMAAELRTELVAWHPAPELLVQFVERREGLHSDERGRIATHLAACPECAAEVRILESLQRPADLRECWGFGMILRHFGTILQHFWATLTDSVLRPVPAAVYLAAAVAALILLLVPPQWHTVSRGVRAVPAGSAPTGLARRAGSPVPEARLGSVVLLSDEAVAVRGPEVARDEVAVLDADGPPFLLLEFADLAQPPRADEHYRVELLPEDSGEVVWQATVRGESFRENYTLCLLFADDVLGAGGYRLLIRDPAGEVIFGTQFEVR